MSAERPDRPQPITKPQEALQIREDVIDAWEQLPTHDKAAVALVLLDRVWKSERGEWLRGAADVVPSRRTA